MSEAVAAQYGYRSKDVARERVKQSLNSVIRSWPREYHSGFLVHFTNRTLGILSEYSTIDTAELVLGALFAGNYFGPEVLKLATQLRGRAQWSNAIKAADNPTIYSKVDPNTGQFSGDILPYNEYYLVAYLAMKTSTDTESKVHKTTATWLNSKQWSCFGTELIFRFPVHERNRGILSRKKLDLELCRCRQYFGHL